MILTLGKFIILGGRQIKKQVNNNKELNLNCGNFYKGRVQSFVAENNRTVEGFSLLSHTSALTQSMGTLPLQLPGWKPLPSTPHTDLLLAGEDWKMA